MFGHGLYLCIYYMFNGVAYSMRYMASKGRGVISDTIPTFAGID
jgi:hypothetical protein